MPARPIRRITDPKVAAEQAAARALDLALEAGSPMKVHFAVNYTSAHSSNKPPRKVSFQEHGETIGGVTLSETESSNSSNRPNSSENDDQLPSPAELAAAKKHAQMKAMIQAKLAESLKQRKELEEESAKVMADFQERKARKVEEEEVKRQTWDTCPNNWKTVVDETGERIKRPAWRALMKRLEEGYIPGVDATVPPQLPQPSKMFALPATTGQRKVLKPEDEALKTAERVIEERYGTSFAVTRCTEQKAQPTDQIQSMVPASSNFGRPSALQATTNNRTRPNTASPATSNTSIAQPGTSMAVIQREIPMIETVRPVQMVIAAPTTPTIRFDAPIEAYERWAAQNFRG